MSKFESKSHCKNGHELTPANVYVAPDGRRRCRLCRRRNARVSARQRRGNAPEQKAYAKLQAQIRARIEQRQAPVREIARVEALRQDLLKNHDRYLI